MGRGRQLAPALLIAVALAATAFVSLLLQPGEDEPTAGSRAAESERRRVDSPAATAPGKPPRTSTPLAPPLTDERETGETSEPGEMREAGEVRGTGHADPAVARVGEARRSADLPDGTLVVAPDGTPTGSGSEESPLDLATALTSDSPVEPGGAVLLRGGTYDGTYIAELEGTRDEPITIRSWPGEWAILDGGRTRENTLTVRGSDTWIRDLEVTRSDPTRTTTEAGSHPSISRGAGDGVAVFGPRTKLINLVVHDNGNGIGFWQPAVDAEVYGVLSFNNGWIGPDRPHGHGMYVQNDSEAGRKRVENSMFFNNFRYGIQGYGVNGHVSGLSFQSITGFENGKPAGELATNLLLGATKEPANHISVLRSIFYSTSPNFDNVRIGFARDVQNQKAEILSNAIVGGSPAFSTHNWRELDVLDNLILARTDKAFGPNILAELWSPSWPLGSIAPVPSYNWDHNSYFEVPSGEMHHARRFLINAEHESRRNHALTFGDWRRESRLDTNSDATLGRPGGVDVHVEPNRYERGRAMITVLNWEGRRSVTVDLSESGLREGRAFEIRDAENYSGAPIVEGVYQGGSLELPMDGRSVTQPVGRPSLDHTSIEFGAFVLLPVER